MCEKMWEWAGQYGDHAYCTLTKTSHFVSTEKEICPDCQKAGRRVRWRRVAEWIRSQAECEDVEIPPPAA